MGPEGRVTTRVITRATYLTITSFLLLLLLLLLFDLVYKDLNYVQLVFDKPCCCCFVACQCSLGFSKLSQVIWRGEGGDMNNRLALINCFNPSIPSSVTDRRPSSRGKKVIDENNTSPAKTVVE